MNKSQIPNPKAQKYRRCILGFGVWTLGFVVLSFGCAARLRLPTDAGTPLPDSADVYRQATSSCAGVKTLTAELALSGKAEGQNLRGRVIAGFARPASM